MLLLEGEQTRPDSEEAEAERRAHAERRSARLRDLGLFTGIVSIVAGILFVVLLSPGGLLAEEHGDDSGSAGHAGQAATALPAAPSADQAKGVKFEPFERVNPDLPAIPNGAVKRFKVDVYEHVTKVSDDLAPTEVWSYAINGVEHRGTGVSDPMVVEVGDKVRIDLINGSSERMHVRMPHSIDHHSSEVNPGEAFKTIGPGERHSFEFVAKHPGVFMYHCATDPVLHHTGAGMVGSMIVKPKNLAPVDRELWITQQEFYIGKPGGQADMQKMQAKQPDVIAFNGYAAQYKEHPITVKRGERVRMFVLNAGPSIWSAFHVIGTVFDRTMIEGVAGRHAQTINLAPSQGGWVEFTLDQEGTYPFVTHAFGDMVKGSVGVLATEHAPGGAMKH
jgi:nitrite reductase (NO-forming)